MKKILLLFIIFNLLFSKTIVVDDDYSSGFFGTDTCEDGDDKYDNIQDALNDAVSGDVIKICAGKYDESDTYQNGDIDELNITKASDVTKPTDVNWTNDDTTFIVQDQINNLYISGIYMNSNDDNNIKIEQSIKNLDIEGCEFNVSSDGKNNIDLEQDVTDTLKIYYSIFNSEADNEHNIYATNNVENVDIRSSEFKSSGATIYFAKDINNNFTLESNEINSSNDYGIIFADEVDASDITSKNNCFYSKDVEHDAKSDDTELTFDKNYWEHLTEDKYDYNNIEDDNPVASCPLILKIDYRMDDCEWDEDNSTYDAVNSAYTGSYYDANAGNEANTTDGGVIYRDGNFSTADGNDTFMIAKNDIDLPSKYTLSVWVKFPLNEDGHKTFSSGGGWFGNSTDYKYFNIADRSGSDNDYIYFRHDTTDDTWDLRIANSDTSDYSTIDMNPQELSGWHMLSFVVNDNGTTFYYDGEKNTSVDANPNTGQIGLIFNSDYDADNDDEPNGQSIGTFVDEFKIFTINFTDDKIKSMYDNEKNGKNWDGSDRDAPQCNEEDSSSSETNSTFNSWDTFRDENDKNISTKIVNKEFNLTLAEFNGTDYTDDFNGTICSTLFNEDNNKQISDWNATKWVDNDDVNETNISFNISKAIKKVKVYMYRIDNEYDDNSSCSDIFNHDGKENNSTDDFALRPNKFNILNISNTLYAGEDFNLSMQALDYKDNNTTDYNESKGDSFDILVLDEKNGCKTGNLNADVTFADGGNTTIANYDEIGFIDVNLTEASKDCSDRFSSVDCKDKNISNHWNSDIDTQIKENNITIKVKPYELNITNVIFNPDKNWIYIDDNLSENSIELNATLKVSNKNGDSLDDFNSTCYGKDVNITFTTILKNPDEFNGTYSMQKGKSTYSDEQNFSDTNFSAFDYNFTIAKEDFNNAEGNLSFKFNIDRNYSKKIKIVDYNFTESNITTSNIAKKENNISLDQNISFYYARLYTKDVYLVGDKNVTELMPILVYDDGSHFKDEKLINWYVQTNNDVNFTSILGTSTTYRYDSDKNVSDFKADIDLQDSEFNLSMGSDNGSHNFVVVHLKTPNYVWYSNYKDYNDSNKSDCISHYCVEYNYQSSASSDSDAGSGKFTGSEVNTSTNIHQKREGVKIYR